MPQVDPVILRLEADIKQYTANVSSAQKLTDQKLGAIEAKGFAMGQNLKKGFNLAATAATAYAATLGVQAITDAISKGLEYASALGEQAQQLGVTSDALQEYRYAATQAGLSSEEMDQALSQLTRRIGEGANGTKAQAQAFDKLGISVKDANGNILNAGEAIPQIADALTKIESPAERAAILMDLFGRAGQKLEPLLSGGSAAVNQLRDAAHNLGIVLSEDQIQRADETADKLASLKMVLSANIAGAVANNAGAILAMAGALETLAAKAGGAITAIQKWRLLVGANQAETFAGGWGKTPEQRDALLQRAANLRAQAAQLDGTQDKTGGFRDYRAAPIKLRGGNIPGLAGTPGVVGAPASGGGPHASAGGSSGPSAAELAQRAARANAQYEDDLGRIRVDRLRAEADYTSSIQDRYTAVVGDLDEELASYGRSLTLDADLTDERRKALMAAKEAVIARQKDIAEQERAKDIADRAAQLSIAELKTQEDALQIKSALADNSRDRRDAELALFDLAERLKEAELDRILATEATASAAWQNAKIEKEGLIASRAGRKEGAKRSSESPMQAYLRKINRSSDGIHDDVETYVVDELQSVQDALHSALSKVIGTKDPLINGLLNLLIEQLVMKPLANALSQVGGGGGGIGGVIGSVVGSLFGRASGGYVAPGQMVRINEAGSPGKVEGFIPQGGGHVIPLGRMNAAAGGGTPIINQTFVLDARHGITTPELIDYVNKTANAKAAEAGQAAYRQSMKDAPTAVAKRQRYGS